MRDTAVIRRGSLEPCSLTPKGIYKDIGHCGTSIALVHRGSVSCFLVVLAYSS